MAHLTRTSWSDGDVPSVNDLRGLTDQSVQVYATPTARSAALSGGAAPEVGQVTFTLSDGVIAYWDGSTWASLFDNPTIHSQAIAGQLPYRSPVYADEPDTGYWTLRELWLMG